MPALFNSAVSFPASDPQTTLKIGWIVAPIEKGTIDLAILSQALHHAPHPERAIASAHRILKKGGRLVILDLLSHRFERARELYADQWLGFSEVQLHQWLEEASFGKLEVTVVSREKESPHFQTVFATGSK